ncbi:hypothetical protein [Mycoplasmopsis gallinarum]|uniref:hypothetical protein n=1 Tax=Mycoplasmopsis gallinarum TaxID=29557 RepID=UPI00047FFE43|nr:hypothetical protein [Mycoplasmopsis gallinarum]
MDFKKNYEYVKDLLETNYDTLEIQFGKAYAEKQLMGIEKLPLGAFTNKYVDNLDNLFEGEYTTYEGGDLIDLFTDSGYLLLKMDLTPANIEKLVDWYNNTFEYMAEDVEERLYEDDIYEWEHYQQLIFDDLKNEKSINDLYANRFKYEAFFKQLDRLSDDVLVKISPYGDIEQCEDDIKEQYKQQMWEEKFNYFVNLTKFNTFEAYIKEAELELGL